MMLHRLAAATAAGLLLLAAGGKWHHAMGQDPVTSLRSTDPLVRASAFEQLRQRRGAFAASGMPDVLLTLLETENALIATTFRESNGTIGIVDRYGEGFGEYVSALAVECAARCDTKRPRAVLALAEAFPGESEYAVKLAADHGALLLPVVLERASQGDTEERRNAMVMLGNIAGGSQALSDRQAAEADSALLACVAYCATTIVPEAVRAVGSVITRNASLSQGRRAAFHRAVVSATAHQDETTRFVAVEALGRFRDSTDLLLLDSIRQHDTKSVAAQAAKASARIRSP